MPQNVEVKGKRGRVLTQGFLTDVDVPSEERLTVQVDVSGMSDVEHMNWVRSIQDLLRFIDVEYHVAVTGKSSEKTNLRRRSVRVRYVKDSSGKQIKIAAFHPYPSMLVNRLKSIRHKVYDVLNEFCLVLQEERVGRMKRKLYFLPAGLAPELMLRIEELNYQLEDLKGKISEFEESENFKAIMKRVAETGVELNFRANLPPIRVSPVPLSLSKQFFMQYVEEEKKKAFLEIDEAKRRGLIALEREMQRKREEMLEALKRNLQDRFATIIALAEEAVKAAAKGVNVNSRAAAKRLERLSRLIENTGVEFDEKPFKALSNVLSAINSKDAEAIKAAVGELAESLGVVPSGDPVRDIEMASRTVRGKSVLLFTID